MRDEDRAEFARLITAALAFYRQDTSDFALDVWWQACQRYTLEQVRGAMTRHALDAERGVFAPKPADLVRMLDGTATDRALRAWGKVHAAMSRVGAYTDVIFDDPAIHAAIEDLGGWPKVCRSDTKDLSYLQHRFTEQHQAYTEAGRFDYPRILTGDRSPNDVYESRGLPPPKPAIVGEQDRAQQVYLGGQIGGKVRIGFGQSIKQLTAPMAVLAS